MVVGFNEQDALLALGVKPIATTSWIGDEQYNVFPWAKDKLGDAKPTVLESVEGLPLDQIKKLEPDLIIGTNAGLAQEDYDALTKIAPTIPNSGASGNDYYEPWPTQTVLVGQAVGKPDQAKKLVDDLTQRYADAAAAHPQWDGVTAAFVQAPYDDGSVIAWPDGLGTDFLTDLGFTIPTSLDKFVSNDVAQAEIPGKDAIGAERRRAAGLGHRHDGRIRHPAGQGLEEAGRGQGRPLALHRRAAHLGHLLQLDPEPAVRAGRAGAAAGAGPARLTARWPST